MYLDCTSVTREGEGEVSQLFWPNIKVICFRMSSLNLSIRGTSSGEVFPYGVAMVINSVN